MKWGALCITMLAVSLLLAPQPLPITQAEPGETVIVALGDSLTAGFGLTQDQSFSVQLERVLRGRGRNVRVVNAGVSGDTAAAGLARLDWAMPDDASAVIVELGANDALQGLPPEATKSALEEIVKRLKARGLPVLLAGMEAPRNLGRDYVEQFAALYRDLARHYDLVFYPFFLEGAALNDGLMQGDGIHPNGQGVARIVANMLPKVEALLARVPPKE